MSIVRDKTSIYTTGRAPPRAAAAPASPEGARRVTRVPPFLGEFSNEDAAWFVDAGVRRRIPAGGTIILEGEPVTELFVILEGAFSVSSQRVRGMPDIRLGPGEIAGEMTFMRRTERPLSSVRALEDAVVLCIPRTALDEKLRSDPGFEARFHKVVAEFTVSRLYNSWAPPVPPAEPPGESPRVYELIEKMLRGEFPEHDPAADPDKNGGKEKPPRKNGKSKKDEGGTNGKDENGRKGKDEDEGEKG